MTTAETETCHCFWGIHKPDEARVCVCCGHYTPMTIDQLCQGLVDAFGVAVAFFEQLFGGGKKR